MGELNKAYGFDSFSYFEVKMSATIIDNLSVSITNL